MGENQDAVVDGNSTCIMLIPDHTYAVHRPYVEEAHLTLAYFGRIEDGDVRLTALRQAVHSIARSIGKPIEARANATGLFPEGESYALVDLIDGIGTFYARRNVENVFGLASRGSAPNQPEIDYTHGFTPHVTRSYVSVDDVVANPLLLLARNPFEFTFDAIGVWHGKNHYEVAL